MKKFGRHPEVPRGDYCYTISSIDKKTGRISTKVCPHWRKRPDKPSQANGYCMLLKHGDWQGKTLGLLWDQVKECGINMRRRS